MIASTEVEDGHELFSDDFDCAFLQSMDYEDERLVLIVYYDPFLKKDVYEWICGVIYGEQTGASDSAAKPPRETCSSGKALSATPLSVLSVEERFRDARSPRLGSASRWFADVCPLRVTAKVAKNAKADADLGASRVPELSL